MTNLDHNSVVVAPDDYNKIFENLIDQDDSNHALVCYVAYVNYKIAKREWVRQFCQDNKRHPNHLEQKSYISTWTDSRLLGLKSEANQMLAAFAEFVVDQERSGIEKRALQHKSFFRDAAVAMVGALFYTLILIGFALVLRVADIDALSIFERVGVKPPITPPSANNPSAAVKPASPK